MFLQRVYGLFDYNKRIFTWGTGKTPNQQRYADDEQAPAASAVIAAASAEPNPSPHPRTSLSHHHRHFRNHCLTSPFSSRTLYHTTTYTTE